MTGRGLVGLVGAAVFGCTVDLLPIKDRSCTAASACPDGYECDMDSSRCTPSAGTDASSSDAEVHNVGPDDAGPHDAGPHDAGPADAAPYDGALGDAGASDAGPGWSCTPYKAGGCQAGQNCVYNSATQTFSCAKAGPNDPWFSCRAQSDCPAGTACVDMNGDQRYYCKPFCQTESDCAPYTSEGVTSCTTNLYDGLTQIAGVFFCAANARAHLRTTMGCVPYKAGGCSAGYNCVYSRTLRDFACAPCGTTTAWYSCTAQSQCSAGTACADNNGDRRYYCRPFCASEADCEPYTTPAVASCTLNLYDGDVQIRGAPFCAADHKAHLF